MNIFCYLDTRNLGAECVVYVYMFRTEPQLELT